MGKQATLRQERKAAREATREQVQAWAAMPEGAVHGPCRTPTCAIPNCTDPVITEGHVETPSYKGPVVIVTWVTGNTEEGFRHYMRINGEIIMDVPDTSSTPRMAAELEAAVIRRFGPSGMIPVLDHMHEMDRRHHAAPKVQA